MIVKMILLVEAQSFVFFSSICTMDNATRVNHLDKFTIILLYYKCLCSVQSLHLALLSSATRAFKWNQPRREPSGLSV